MKIICVVRGKPAVIVGYVNGKKNRPMAIVLSDGKLDSVRLKDVKLQADEEPNVTPLRRKEGAA